MRHLTPVLTLLIAPLLLAPVRLKDATPAFFTPPAQSPAPESYSLPAAQPLTTPTVIPVKPTFLPPSTTIPPNVMASPTSLNLPLPPSPTLPLPNTTHETPNTSDTMSPLQSALCQKGMQLVQELSQLSYQQRPNRGVMRLTIAAATAQNDAASRQWPNLTAFNYASSHLPWFGQPQKAEILDASAAAHRLCEQ